MNINEIFQMITDNLTPFLLLITAILGVVEKSQKLIWTPITNFLKWLGKKINAETLEQIETIQNSQKEIKKAQDASIKTVEEIKTEQHNLSKQITDITNRQLSDEAYSLNDFYLRHETGEKLTREQYELAIKMFEEHLACGANHVNKLHLEALKTYYMHTWADVD